MSLVVYKSSAGSGKTTTLVNEYLSICLKRPGDFKHILAITFTNKAAKEMKELILATLKAIADNNWSRDVRIVLLFKKVNLGEEVFVRRAKSLLSTIIHRYEDFSVSTIDSFVHKVIRTFASEVKLPPNFEVVLNNDDLIPDVIQSLYDKVGSDKVLTDILVKFVLGQTANEKSPDPSFMLRSFIQNQLGEESFIEVKKLSSLTTPQLWDIIKKLLEEFKQKQLLLEREANNILQLFKDHHVDPGDLAGGKNGIYGFFNKISGIRFQKVETLAPTKTTLKNVGADKWYSTKASVSAKAAIDQLLDQVMIAFERLNEQLESYFYLYLLNKKVYTLALVHELRQLLTAYTEETGKVHISEFNKLVYNEIAEQPVPFIYERLGKKYRYFLIDEFQDTSVLQWNNLLPLIDESLSYGHFNMLVGDAKQAIYRFRSGEVELFSGLPKIYGHDGSLLASERENQLTRSYEEVSLESNWRSHQEIIDFNNKFFDYLKSKASPYIQKIYLNHNQQVPTANKPGGLVQIDLVVGSSKEELLLQKQQKMEAVVADLIVNQYKMGDIGVLCRTGELVRSYAAFLMSLGYAVLSEESLLVSNSPEVRLLAAFFQLLVNPNEDITQLILVENYRVLHHPEVNPDIYYRQFLAAKGDTFEDMMRYFGVVISKEVLERKPLTEIADFGLRHLVQTEVADIFVQYYFEFLQHAPQSLIEMNQLWEDKKDKYFIATPEGTDAIQVMTVHKAKGLAFGAVIVDAETERIRMTKQEFWMKTGFEGDETLGVALFPLNKSLELIGKEKVYEHEKDRSELDFVNLVYVAFTRPIKALYIFAHLKEEDTPQKLAATLLGFLKFSSLYSEKVYHYSFGHLPPVNEKTLDNTMTYKLEKWKSFPWQNNSWVAKADEPPLAELALRSKADYGVLVHFLLAQVKTSNDVGKMLDRQFELGYLLAGELGKLNTILNQVVNHPQLKECFAPGGLIKNETEVLLENGSIIRPDRVVKIDDEIIILDYKTGSPEKSHQAQLFEYKRAFLNLGFKQVKAMLVYIGPEIIVVNVG